jgi:two-component system, chemotaxis family, protein-glutamate methylesterase/glutaminase
MVVLTENPAKRESPRGQVNFRRFRPSIDALFRSAAVAYGPRVVGVILTGALSDSAVGLLAVKDRGGFAVVQDPEEAAVSQMPRAALRRTEVDACLPLAQIPALLTRLSGETAPEEGGYVMPESMDIEARIARQDLNSKQLLEAVEAIGSRSTYTCPECHGALWQVKDERLVRFRCYVGHAYNASTLLASQSERSEEALWSATRALEEAVTLTRQLAEEAQGLGDQERAQRYLESAIQLDERVTRARQVILSTPPATALEPGDGPSVTE